MVPQHKAGDSPPALELLIIQSTTRRHRLSLRLARGEHKRSGEVMEQLAPSGFLEGDRVTLEIGERFASRTPGVVGLNLDLVVRRSSADPSRLTLRCLDDEHDGNEVMERLFPAGFRPGDRAQLRLLWRKQS